MGFYSMIFVFDTRVLWNNEAITQIFFSLQILSIEGVLSYRDQHIWQHSSDVMCGIVHIQVSQTASEQHVTTHATSILKSIGLKNITVQVEKEAFFQHLTGLNSASSTFIDNYSNVGLRAVWPRFQNICFLVILLFVWLIP